MIVFPIVFILAHVILGVTALGMFASYAESNPVAAVLGLLTITVNVAAIWRGVSR